MTCGTRKCGIKIGRNEHTRGKKILNSGNLEGKLNYKKGRKKERKKEVRRKIKWTKEKDSEYVE